MVYTESDIAEFIDTIFIGQQMHFWTLLKCNKISFEEAKMLVTSKTFEELDTYTHINRLIKTLCDSFKNHFCDAITIKDLNETITYDYTIINPELLEHLNDSLHNIKDALWRDNHWINNNEKRQQAVLEIFDDLYKEYITSDAINYDNILNYLPYELIGIENYTKIIICMSCLLEKFFIYVAFVYSENINLADFIKSQSKALKKEYKEQNSITSFVGLETYFKNIDVVCPYIKDKSIIDKIKGYTYTYCKEIFYDKHEFSFSRERIGYEFDSETDGIPSYIESYIYHAHDKTTKIIYTFKDGEWFRDHSHYMLNISQNIKSIDKSEVAYGVDAPQDVWEKELIRAVSNTELSRC